MATGFVAVLVLVLAYGLITSNLTSRQFRAEREERRDAVAAACEAGSFDGFDPNDALNSLRTDLGIDPLDTDYDTWAAVNCLGMGSDSEADGHADATTASDDGAQANSPTGRDYEPPSEAPASWGFWDFMSHDDMEVLCSTAASSPEDVTGFIADTAGRSGATESQEASLVESFKGVCVELGFSWQE